MHSNLTLLLALGNRTTQQQTWIGALFAHSIGRLTQLWEPLRKHASEQSAALNSGGGGPAPGSAEEDPNAIPPALMGVPSGPGAPVLLGDASVIMASSTAGGNHGAGVQVEGCEPWAVQPSWQLSVG